MENTRKMKMTSIGLFPEDWEIVQLGTKASVLRGGSPRPIDSFLTNDPDGINWIKIGDVAVGAKYIKQTEEKIIPEGAARSRKVYAGDFLLSNSMSFGRPYILQIDGCIHDGWLVIQEYYDTFETDYLYYALNAEYVLEQYKSMAAGSSVLNLNKDIVKRVNVAVPTRSEQKRIADALYAVDELIGALDEAIAKKRQIKEGLMQQLLTPHNGGQRVERHGRDLFSIGNGRDYKNLGSGTIPVFGTGGLMASVDDYLYDGPTVCIGRKGTIDRPQYHDGKIWTVDTLFYTYDFNGVNPKFLYYLFCRVNWHALNEATGVPSLTSNNILNVSFQLPPKVEEQDYIVSILDAVKEEIRSLENKRNKCALIKQGMMQELLTGKTRLI